MRTLLRKGETKKFEASAPKGVTKALIREMSTGLQPSTPMRKGT